MFKKLYLFLWLLCGKNLLQAQTTLNHKLDSAKFFINNNTISAEAYFRTGFYIADNFMDLDQYDSAQVWLNKIYDRLPVKKPTLFNYFLSSRQAEVYYYNNLHSLGLQEIFGALKIAEQLQDNHLLADSYDFMGLFYLNLDSLAKAKQSFVLGLKYLPAVPPPDSYIALTQPHHLYGNLSETYFKLKKYDSALHYINISLHYAKVNSMNRGVAVAQHGVADVYLQKNRLDSAIYYYKLSMHNATISKDIDIVLYGYTGLANCFDIIGDTKEASLQLKSGLDFFKANKNINLYYGTKFLAMASDLYRKNNDYKLLSEVLLLKSELETKNVKSNNTQVQNIFLTNINREKELLKYEISSAKQKQTLANIQLIVLGLVLFISTIGFLVYRYIQQQKLNASKRINSISRDLHDDIGASLSSLQIYGTVAEKYVNSNPEKALEMIGKISTQSKGLMEEMNDIVWSMKANVDGAVDIEHKIKNYGVSFLGEKDITVNYKLDKEVLDTINSIDARKNILLIIKEAFNNIAKYSNCTKVIVEMYRTGNNFQIVIQDNGIGFDTTTIKNGNGLLNMQTRAAILKGVAHIESKEHNGTRISIVIPLKML
jgi:signal transduction histidine kinase